MLDLSLLFLASLSASSHVAAGPIQARWSDPVVDLPFVSYRGFYNETSNLSTFLGVRYAQDPSGDNRWRAAKAPLDQRKGGIVDAKTMPFNCPQVSSGGDTNATTYSPLQPQDSEDCLFVNIYSPVYAPSKETEKLPVMVWIHGGAWRFNGAREFDPTPMINYSNNSFIGVIVQYRLGAFGLLASPGIKESGGLNAAITDARFALEFVNKHIDAFGGDKDRVTVMGESAGAGTIEHLAVAEAGRSPALFQSAIAISPAIRAQHQCTDERAVRLFDNFSKVAGCERGSEEQVLACLRAASSGTLRVAANKMLNGTFDEDGFQAYAPCAEGPNGYLKKPLAQTVRAGTTVAGQFALVTNNWNDGRSPALYVSGFNASANATNEAIARKDLQTLLPLNDTILDAALSLYAPEMDEGGWSTVADVVQQDVVFACSSNWMAEAYGSRGRKGVFAVNEPRAYHATDNAYEFPIWYGSRAPRSPQMFASFTGAFISQTLASSPDAVRGPLVGSEPTWPAYLPDRHAKVFNLTMDPVTFENVSTTYISESDNRRAGRSDRCDFWRSVRSEGVGW